MKRVTGFLCEWNQMKKGKIRTGRSRRRRRKYSNGNKEEEVVKKN